MDLLRSIEPNLLLFAGVFLGVLLAFEGIRQLLSRRETTREATSRRMRLINAGVAAEEVLRLLNPPVQKTWLAGVPFLHDVPLLLRQAGSRLGAGGFLALCLLGSVPLAAAGTFLLPPLLAGPVAVLVTVLLAVAVLRHVSARRLARLTAQLPDALDLMARGLKVGHPLNATIASVAEDMIDPIATEFGILVDQVSFGEEIVDAFRALAVRIDTEDFKQLAAAVAIQHGTGGNLARVLRVLADVIRKRAIMKRKIRALSSEGRISAQILSVIPIAIFGASSILSPQYYWEVADDPLFKPIAIVTVVLVIANALVLRKLVSFKF